MKDRILLFAILTTLSVQISQNESLAADLAVLSSPIRGITIQQSYPGMPRLDYSKMPWLDYSKLPWLKDFPRSQPYTIISAAGLLANLKADIDSAASGLTALTDSLHNDQQNAMVTGEATALAVDYSTLMAQDLSTLLSQDLSVNYGQLLSTSLAVPTCPPRPNWNKQAPVVVQTPAGEVAVPTYPPRTAWGNGGMVATTPGGAVYSVVPPASQARSPADFQTLRDVSRQLEFAQENVQRLQTFLENINAGTNPPRVILQPAIPKDLKPGSPVSDRELPSSRPPSN